MRAPIFSVLLACIALPAFATIDSDLAGNLSRVISNAFEPRDIARIFFASPNSRPATTFVGVGPVFLWPTASDAAIARQEWGAGPMAIALQQNSASRSHVPSSAVR